MLEIVDDYLINNEEKDKAAEPILEQIDSSSSNMVIDTNKIREMKKKKFAKKTPVDEKPIELEDLKASF